ncbi:Disease resistance protein [Musa troglodytarum]|uniref:Disease resistance protein n=1 Tax=Musa troglodytarum TaxID=320322 RepID=A0A9E7G659_9LILI|nr:Disease resistance protein [Musa troglodytarum]
MGKRFLIVLDDVWEESNTNWENLCVPLNSGERGSKIVVTTTNQNVAKMMRTKEIIHLDGVEGEEYWELVREHDAFRFNTLLNGATPNCNMLNSPHAPLVTILMWN